MDPEDPERECMTIKEIIELGKLGYSKEEVKELLSMQEAQEAPAAAPAPAEAPEWTAQFNTELNNTLNGFIKNLQAVNIMNSGGDAPTARQSSTEILGSLIGGKK